MAEETKNPENEDLSLEEIIAAVKDELKIDKAVQEQVEKALEKAQGQIEKTLKKALEDVKATATKAVKEEVGKAVEEVTAEPPMVQISAGEVWFNPNVCVIPKPEAVEHLEARGIKFEPKSDPTTPAHDAVPLVGGFAQGLIGEDDEITPMFFFCIADKNGKIVTLPADLVEATF